jgi:hypothetical protein
VIDGTATVSVDGKSATTDPGTGITHPGWHGLTPPGTTTNGNIGQPCLDPQGQVIIALRDAGNIGKATFELIKGTDGIASSLGKLVGISSGILSETAHSLFTGFGIADDLAQVLNLDDHTPWDKRLKAGASLLLEGSLLFAEVTGAVVAPEVLAAATLTKLAKSVLTLNQGGDDLAAAVRAILAVGQLPPCDPTMTQQARQAANTLATDAQRMGNQASGAITDLGQIGMLAPEIGDILAKGDPNAPFYGLSDSDRAAFENIIAEYDHAINDIDNQGPIWQEGPQVVNDIGSFTAFYTGPAQSGGMSGGPGGGGSMPQPIQCPLYWSAEFGNTVLRGRTSGAGNINFFAAPNQLIRVQVYDPIRKQIGTAVTFTGTSGNVSNLGLIPMLSDTGTDPANNGLSSEAAFVIGLDPTKYSTAGDGISDGAKVLECLDPLNGRAFPTGVIASP